MDGYEHYGAETSRLSDYPVKGATWLDIKPNQRKEFSMAAIEAMHYNKIIADWIFANLRLKLSFTRIK